MSKTFSPLATLPGWEATDGRFVLCPWHGLRFVRAIRRLGDRVAYVLNDDTPRAVEIRIAEFARALATAEAA